MSGAKIFCCLIVGFIVGVILTYSNADMNFWVRAVLAGVIGTIFVNVTRMK